MSECFVYVLVSFRSLIFIRLRILEPRKLEDDRKEKFSAKSSKFIEPSNILVESLRNFSMDSKRDRRKVPKVNMKNEGKARNKEKFSSCSWKSPKMS